MKKKLIIKGNVCEYIKLDSSIEFVCNRYKKKKTSKKHCTVSSRRRYEEIVQWMLRLFTG